MVSVQCTECLAMFQIGTRLDRHTSNSRLSRDLCLFSTGLKFEPSEAPLLCTSSRINPKGSRVRLEAGNLSASIGQNHFIQNNLQANLQVTSLHSESSPGPGRTLLPLSICRNLFGLFLGLSAASLKISLSSKNNLRVFETRTKMIFGTMPFYPGKCYIVYGKQKKWK